MKYLFPTLLAVVICTATSAQKTASVTVKAGTNIMDALKPSEVFYFPQFTAGSVHFRDGSITAAKLNYSRLVDEMHFISPKGDTLALTNEATTRMIVFGNDTFTYDKGWLKLLGSGSRAKLALKQTWVIADAKLIGAYGTTNTPAAITTFRNMNEGGRLYDLVINEDLVLSKVQQYFIGDRNGRFLPAIKKNLLSLFPKEKSRIEQFLKENKIDFSNENDLVKTVQFVETL